MGFTEQCDVDVQWRWRWKHFGNPRAQISRLSTLSFLLLSFSPLMLCFITTSGSDGVVHRGGGSPSPSRYRDSGERDVNNSSTALTTAKNTVETVSQTSRRGAERASSGDFSNGEQGDDVLQSVAPLRTYEGSEGKTYQLSGISSLPPAVPQHIVLAAAPSHEQEFVTGGSTGVNLPLSPSSSDGAAAEGSTLRDGAAGAPARPAEAVAWNDSSSSNSEERSSRSGSGNNSIGSTDAGGNRASVSDGTTEDAVSPRSGSSGGTLNSESKGRLRIGTSTAIRDHDFGWSSAAGNTALQNRMCRALKADRQLVSEFMLFALTLVDSSTFVPARRARSSASAVGASQRGQQQTSEQQPDPVRQQEGRRPRQTHYAGEQTEAEQDQRKQYRQQGQQQTRGEETPAPGSDTAKSSRRRTVSQPEGESAESLQNMGRLVPWKVVMKFLEKLQGRALFMDDLAPQYVWQKRAPCRLLPLAAAQLQRIAWSMEAELKRLVQQQHPPSPDVMWAAAPGPPMLPYDTVVNELLEQATKQTESTKEQTGGNSSKGNAGAAPWNVERMKALAESAPKLSAAETSLELLLNVSASLWSSYLVITDLEAGRTVEAVVWETAGQRINTVRRRYGNALQLLSDTTKELVSDGHLCGHLFVLLEDFVSSSVVESMPWYDVEYFEGELLRHMHEEFIESVKPLEEALSIAAGYKAERSAERAALFAKVAAAVLGSKFASRERDSGHSWKEGERKDGGKKATKERATGRRLSTSLETLRMGTYTKLVSGLRAIYGNKAYLHDGGRSGHSNASTRTTGSSSGYRWKGELARDRVRGTAAVNEASRRLGGSEEEEQAQFRQFTLPELRLNGYHVRTLHGIFNAGVVGESTALDVSEALAKVFTSDGVLAEIQLCPRHDRFVASLEDDEPGITDWMAKTPDSDNRKSTTHDSSRTSVKSDNSRSTVESRRSSTVDRDSSSSSSKTVDTGQTSSSGSSSRLTARAGRRLESVSFTPLNHGLDNSSAKPKNHSARSKLEDPPGAVVTAQHLRHKQAVAAAASGASAAVAEAAAAAAAAARRETAAALAPFERADDDDDDDDDDEVVHSAVSPHTGADPAATRIKPVFVGGARLRGERASLGNTPLHSADKRSRSAPAAPTYRREALGEAATAEAIAKAAAQADRQAHRDEEAMREPRVPLLLTMQAFSRHLGEGKPLWIFNKCRVVHSTIDDRHGTSSIYHHVMLSPETDTDIHFFVSLPAEGYTKRAGEELRETFLLLGRTTHIGENSRNMGSLLQLYVRDSRLQLLGTAQRAQDGHVLKLQSFGLSLNENQRHNVDQFIHKDKLLLHFRLTGLASLRTRLPRGQEWRYMRADRLFARIISTSRFFVEIPYAIKEPIKTSIHMLCVDEWKIVAKYWLVFLPSKRVDSIVDSRAMVSNSIVCYSCIIVELVFSRSKRDSFPQCHCQRCGDPNDLLAETESGGVPPWLLATAVVCTALPLLLFMFCLQFNGYMPMPWWLTCVFSSRPPWGDDLPPAPADEESPTLTRVTTRSLSATSDRMRRYTLAARECVNALYEQQEYQKQQYEQQQQQHELQEQHWHRHSREGDEEQQRQQEQQRQEEQEQQHRSGTESPGYKPTRRGVLVAQPLLNRRFRNVSSLDVRNRRQWRRQLRSGPPSLETRSHFSGTATPDSGSRGYLKKEGPPYRRSVTLVVKSQDADGHVLYRRSKSGAEHHSQEERQKTLAGADVGYLSDGCLSGRAVPLPKGSIADGVFPEAITRQNTRIGRRHAKEIRRKRSTGETSAARRPTGEENFSARVKTTGTRLKLTAPGDSSKNGATCLPQGIHGVPSRPPESTHRDFDVEHHTVFSTAQTASSCLSSIRTETPSNHQSSSTGATLGRKKTSGTVVANPVVAKMRNLPSEDISSTCATGQGSPVLTEPPLYVMKQELSEGCQALSAIKKRTRSTEDVSNTTYCVTHPKKELERNRATRAKQSWNPLENVEESCTPEVSASRRGAFSGAGTASGEQPLKKASAYSAGIDTPACPVTNKETQHDITPKNTVSQHAFAVKRKGSSADADKDGTAADTNFESACTETAGYARTFCASSSGETTVRWRRSNTALTQTSTVDASWSSTHMKHDDLKMRRSTGLGALQENPLRDRSEFSE